MDTLSTWTKTLAANIIPGQDLFAIFIRGLNFAQGYYIAATDRADAIARWEEDGRKMSVREECAVFGAIIDGLN